jgi:hypothetical protein
MAGVLFNRFKGSRAWSDSQSGKRFRVTCILVAAVSFVVDILSYPFLIHVGLSFTQDGGGGWESLELLGSPVLYAPFLTALAGIVAGIYLSKQLAWLLSGISLGFAPTFLSAWAVQPQVTAGWPLAWVRYYPLRCLEPCGRTYVFTSVALTADLALWMAVACLGLLLGFFAIKVSP